MKWNPDIMMIMMIMVIMMINDNDDNDGNDDNDPVKLFQKRGKWWELIVILHNFTPCTIEKSNLTIFCPPWSKG